MRSALKRRNVLIDEQFSVLQQVISIDKGEVEERGDKTEIGRVASPDHTPIYHKRIITWKIGSPTSEANTIIASPQLCQMAAKS